MRLGDFIAAAVAKIGLTEECVERVLGRPCGCAKRRAKLNKLGRSIRRRWAKAMSKRRPSR